MKIYRLSNKKKKTKKINWKIQIIQYCFINCFITNSGNSHLLNKFNTVILWRVIIFYPSLHLLYSIWGPKALLIKFPEYFIKMFFPKSVLVVRPTVTERWQLVSFPSRDHLQVSKEYNSTCITSVSYFMETLQGKMFLPGSFLVVTEWCWFQSTLEIIYITMSK